MSVSSINGYTSSSKTRISGMASGMDTDQMIKDLMKAERLPYDKLAKQKQISQWKTDSYRDITRLVKGIKDEYFDVAKMSTNLLSQAAYKTMTVTSSATAFSVTANADATPGTYEITVESLATAGSVKSSTPISKNITGSQSYNFEGAKGKKFMLAIDGIAQQITIPSDMTAAPPVANETPTQAILRTLNTAIDEAFGKGKIVVGADPTGILKFAPVSGSGITNVSISDVADETKTAVAALGFTSSSNYNGRINTSSKLADLNKSLGKSFDFTYNDGIRFSINNVEFTFASTDTLQNVIDKVNSTESANVNMKYDTLSDSVKIESKRLGAGTSVNISDEGGNFLQALNLTYQAEYGIEANFDPGTDAVMIIDKQKVTRSDNAITLGGTVFTLKEIKATPETITIARNNDNLFNTVKNFVTKYNEMLGKVNTKISEKYDRDYQPLTQDERASMTDDQIKKWEEKAKTGLLRNDPILQNMLDGMNRVLTDKVKGSSISLSSIGIASTSYQDKGVLTVDEDALRKAINSAPDAVQKLFSAPAQEFDTTTPTAAQKRESYASQGIVSRLYDVIEANITPIRDVNGKKGILLEQAGLEGDFSEINSTLFNQIADYDIRMKALVDKLSEKETAYYKKFSAMEKALAKMNSQSSWLSAQFK